VAANHSPATEEHALTGFVKPGGIHLFPAQKKSSMLAPGKEWQILADLRKQLVFPREIMNTTLQPEIIMWSTVVRRALLIELTNPLGGEFDNSP